MNAKHLRLAVALCSLLVLTSTSIAQEGGGLTVYAGANSFGNPTYDSLVLIEFPFSIKRHELEFYRVDENTQEVESRVLALVRLADPLGNPIDSAVTYFSVRAADKEEAAIEGLRIFNKLSLMVSPGSYSADLSVIDAISRNKGEYHFDFIPVSPPIKDHLNVSKALFAYSARMAREDDPSVNPRLVKNGLELTPNPKSIYGTEDSMAFVYAEIYNLQTSSDAGKYFMALTVLDEKQDVFRQLGGRVTEKPAEAAVVAEKLDIKDWPAGLYWLRIMAKDLDSEQADSSLTPFRVVDASTLVAQYEATKTVYAHDSLDLKTNLQVVRYLLTPDQKRTLNSLAETGKENYLSQFWREMERQGPINGRTQREEYTDRYLYANARFSTDAELNNGWLTARGRIYMIYGPYDQINDVAAPLTEEAPYQVWYYFYGVKDRGQFFVFEDPYGDNDYRLVHSNVEAEVYSREWQQKIDAGDIDVMRF